VKLHFSCVHSPPVFVYCSIYLDVSASLPNTIITGAHDGRIRIWNQDQYVQQLSLVTEASLAEGNNSALAVDSPHQGRISGLAIDDRTK
jgi:hypothetical protein